MRAIAALGTALILCSTVLVSAQEKQEPPASTPENSGTIERTVAAETGKETRIGVYLNLKPDCTSGALPILRLTHAPQGGRVLIKRSKIQVTNAGACLSAEAPGYVAFYQSRPDFSGADKIAIEIKLPDRDTVRVQKITINVRANGTNL
jgi:hypothetical protein